ncbi:hypothetical protein BDR03DRAFT_994443 [Suillus americanus]|nr:hypothetical protein BDR03DRAFT_994443 [Suillus americanus]
MNTRFSVPDIEAEALVLALSLLDIEEVEGSRKGKSREDACLTDEEIAFNFQAENLKSSLAELRDRRFALSLDEALQTDTAALSAMSLINQGEQDDHLSALALERGDDVPTPTNSQEVLERNGFLSVECIICGDPVRRSQVFNAPCSHFYCRGCLVNLVEASTRDETLYPVRCCQKPLPVANFLPWLPSSLRSHFQDKSAEFATPPTSRIYCPNQTCSKFLGSSSDRRPEIECSCGTRVCSACRNRAHLYEDCAENAQTSVIKSLASQMGWQTCPGCHAIVELWQGCYHMTCRCSTQFCYLCAALWKTCDCRQWDDQRLLDDAERRVYNEFGAQEAAARPEIFVDRVYQRMAALEENHECAVHRWVYRSGGGRCEECHDNLWSYLMRCRHCQVLVCRRCSVNRL